MIISASRRTDIPAFYSTWFMNRLRAGHCLVPNPYNPKQIRQISLAPDDVDAIVFWSKNPKPLLQHLPELHDRGTFFYFQFTLNDYPPALEPGVPPVQERLATFRELAYRLGPERVIWRYDPIIISPSTGYEFHARVFERLSSALAGATRRVVVSVVDLYRKTLRNMQPLAKEGLAIDTSAPDNPPMLKLLGHLRMLAQAEGMSIFTCAERHDFAKAGIHPGSCIDGALIGSFGGKTSNKKDPGQRTACACVESRDIGVPNTCLHGCRYCYATQNHVLAQTRAARHDPESAMI